MSGSDSRLLPLPAAGLARTARAAAKRLAAPAAVTDPQSSSGSSTAGAMRGALLAWAHFLLLPEPVNRELRGQGYLGWARGSAAWRAVASGIQGSCEEEGETEGEASSYASSLLRLARNPLSLVSSASSSPSQRQPRRRRIIRADAPSLPPPPRGSTPVRVELRDGSALSVVARPGSTLGGLSASIEKDLGILEEAQRFLVVEEPEPGIVAKVAGTAALAALRFSAGLAASTARRAAAVAGTAAAVVGVKGGGAGGEEGEEGERGGGGGTSGGSASGPFSIVVRRSKQSSSRQQQEPPLEFEVDPEATMAQVRAAVDAALLAEAEEEEEEEGAEEGERGSSSSSRSSGHDNDRPSSSAAAAATSISLVFPGRGRRRVAATAPKQQSVGGGGSGRQGRQRKAFASEIVRIEAAV